MDCSTGEGGRVKGVRIWVRNSDGEVNSTETKKGNKNKNKIK
jgi:hypothetical protein